DEEPPQTFVLQINGCPHSSGHNPANTPFFAAITAHPDQRHEWIVFRTGYGRIGGVHPTEDFPPDQDSGVGPQMGNGVDVGRAPQIGYAAENGMILEGLVNDAAGAFLAMTPMMIDPGFTQYLLAKPARPLFVTPIEAGVRALFVMIVCESMGAGAQRDDRFTAIEIIDKVFHLVVGQFAETQRHNTQAG